MDRLNLSLDSVKDEKTFITFFKALHEYVQTNKNNWKNMNIENYLDACIAWYKDSKNLKKNQITKNPCRICAEILYCVKIYE